ncbi:MAG: hypothetical protein FWH56_11750 [Betaproteobacteria bacterium]|nr:hypothetical protein [Betaproteobacteria bacterium]
MDGWLRDLGDNRAGRVEDLLLGVHRMKTCVLTSRLDKPLSKRFVFKLAQTREELEACFRLLHDEYVLAGFMEPDPSGMRVTLHHALPTTSTLMCRYGKRVVGTVSLIRENGLGFPMQRIFDLGEIVREGGSVAEVSALAIDRRFHVLKDRIMMPLLKFLYEYAEYRFDTRHLMIAAHPRHIGFYEEVLCFRRLSCSPVDHYDFVNNAPAIGAYLDLDKAKECFFRKYGNTPLEKNLYHYFAVAALPNGQFPHQRFDTAADPVMTPELMDYFFNRRTKIFSTLGTAEIRLLHTVYNLSKYQGCLPPLPDSVQREHGRNHVYRRFSVRRPAWLRVSQTVDGSGSCGVSADIALTVYECSEKIFCAHADRPLSVGLNGEADVKLDMNGLERCILPVEVVRLSRHSDRVIMLRIRDGSGEQGELWLRFIHALSDIGVPATSHFEETSLFGGDVLPPALQGIFG